MRRHQVPNILSFLLLFVLIIFIPCSLKIGKKVYRTAADEHIKKPDYYIYIDLEISELYLIKNNKLYKTYKCSGGKEKTPSPIGTWTIVSKANWGDGFGGYWMGLSCPWGIFGIHGTTKQGSIGRPASHGCIRLLSEDAAEIYNLVPHGTKVIITDGPYGPFGKGFRKITPGMYGADVLEIQKYLKAKGYYTGPCNGIYDGLEFLTAVYKYQSDNGFTISNTITPSLIKSMGFKLID